MRFMKCLLAAVTVVVVAAPAALADRAALEAAKRAREQARAKAVEEAKARARADAEAAADEAAPDDEPPPVEVPAAEPEEPAPVPPSPPGAHLTRPALCGTTTPCLHVLDDASVAAAAKKTQLPAEALAGLGEFANPDGPYGPAAWLVAAGVDDVKLLVLSDCRVLVLEPDGVLTPATVNTTEPLEEAPMCDGAVVADVAPVGPQLVLSKTPGGTDCGQVGVEGYQVVRSDGDIELRQIYVFATSGGCANFGEGEASESTRVRSSYRSAVDAAGRPLLLGTTTISWESTDGAGRSYDATVENPKRFRWTGTGFVDDRDAAMKAKATANERLLAAEQKKAERDQQRAAAAAERDRKRQQSTAMGAIPGLLGRCKTLNKQWGDLERAHRKAHTARDLRRVDAVAKQKQGVARTYTEVLQKLKGNLTTLRETGASDDVISSARRMIREECGRDVQP
jgi:hypothetical protein